MLKISINIKNANHLATRIDEQYSKTLCGKSFNSQKVIKTVLHRWETGQNICSNCWWSQTAVADRLKCLYPTQLNNASGNTFEAPKEMPYNELHRWQEFSQNTVAADRTQVSIKNIVVSARVDSFRIIKNGFLELATPNVPGALPVLEISEYIQGATSKNNLMTSNIIVDTHNEELVYYPVMLSLAESHWPHTNVRQNSLANKTAYQFIETNEKTYDKIKMKLFTNWEIILTELDKTIISETINSALKCKHYYDLDKPIWTPTP